MEIGFKGNRLPSQQLLIAWQPPLIIHLLEEIYLRRSCKSIQCQINQQQAPVDLVSIAIGPGWRSHQGKVLLRGTNRLHFGWLGVESHQRGKSGEKDEKRPHLVVIHGLQCSVDRQEPLSVV